MAILKINGKIAHSLGRSISITPATDVILSFDVIGTFFPARDAVTNNSYLRIVGKDGVSNTLYIDYNDGTGEHAYPFKASGVSRRVNFETNANVTTPAGLATTGFYDVNPLYFFQDLPVGVKNTVNDTYGTPRTIRLRFEKPEAVVNISFNRVRLYNTMPSALARLVNLETLSVNSSNYITAFPQDFYNSRIKQLVLTYVGSAFNAGLPNWVLNSPLETLSLTEGIDLSNDPVGKRFTQINKLKNTLKTLNLSTASINYTLPSEVGELTKLEAFTLNNNDNVNMRLNANLPAMVAMKTFALNTTRMPFTEIARIFSEMPTVEWMDIRRCNYISDYDIATVNTGIKELYLGNQSWNGGQLPSFLNKLTGLKILHLDNISSNTSTLISGYGSFPNCVNLEQLDIMRCTALTTDVPAWFSNFTKLKIVNAYSSFNTTTRIDTWVNNFYTFVTANASMVAGTTKFRNMIVTLYGTASNDVAVAVRPSGTYQQPSGYVTGSSDGAPASPMEKIWVLTNQYGHTFTVKPL